MSEKAYFSKSFLLLVLGIGTFFGSVFAAVNYAEYFPNLIALYQSQQNGWVTPINSSKEIVAPGSSICRIDSIISQQFFIPTLTQDEWDAFKLYSPTGVSVSNCNLPTATYAWNSGLWGACSAVCDGGVIYGSVWCERSDGMKVSQTYCGGAKPPASYSCNTYACDGCTMNLGSPDYYVCDGTYHVPMGCPNPEVAWHVYYQYMISPPLAGCTLTNYNAVYNAYYTYWHYPNAYSSPGTPINGSCGSANGGIFASTPTANLCSAGTPSLVTLSSTTWLWSCYGSSAGANIDCSASK